MDENISIVRCLSKRLYHVHVCWHTCMHQLSALLLHSRHAADSPHTFGPDEPLFLSTFYNVAVSIRHQTCTSALTLRFYFFHLARCRVHEE
uniref:Uncharacterized protein n=1 Tax=Onchocerca volvulus TaxID=6282 RepID=A0A8R1TWG6_ONCVO